MINTPQKSSAQKRSLEWSHLEFIHRLEIHSIINSITKFDSVELSPFKYSPTLSHILKPHNTIEGLELVVKWLKELFLTI